MTQTPACQAILSSIAAYLDGDLDATACVAIEQHTATCAECRSVIEGLRQTVGLCREVATAPLPESVRQRARASIQALLARPSTPPPHA